MNVAFGHMCEISVYCPVLNLDYEYTRLMTYVSGDYNRAYLLIEIFKLGYVSHGICILT